MDEIFGKYRQDFSEIRRLCLVCHGLDLSTSALSSDLSTWVLSEATNSALQNLVSSTLLHLAIAIRTNLYQKRIKGSDIRLENSAWFYYDEELIERPATLKQVCDKIVHADTFSKSIYPKEFADRADKIATQIRGAEHNRKAWTMNLVLDLLAEDILSMLDQIEANVPNQAIHATSA
ncbi:hypothetical protein [Gilvimarinus algae]|uniref:Uncharacterized protein n=1 Tax=Gilvimarinus algae TaxID=3058037 RepID=A0ABT8TB78_9GAMM|nr:hypothetical protein [Gilvimarinus sp. SDUM040014]MDO3381201.1 hypothetical protein [Gilvimarinus sp. SDUM040014]